MRGDAAEKSEKRPESERSGTVRTGRFERFRSKTAPEENGASRERGRIAPTVNPHMYIYIYVRSSVHARGMLGEESRTFVNRQASAFRRLLAADPFKQTDERKRSKRHKRRARPQNYLPYIPSTRNSASSARATRSTAVPPHQTHEMTVAVRFREHLPTRSRRERFDAWEATGGAGHRLLLCSCRSKILSTSAVSSVNVFDTNPCPLSRFPPWSTSISTAPLETTAPHPMGHDRW